MDIGVQYSVGFPALNFSDRYPEVEYWIILFLIFWKKLPYCFL